MLNNEMYKLIKRSYTYNVYTPYESYLYNKGWIDCLETNDTGYVIDTVNCHILNGDLLNKYSRK